MSDQIDPSPGADPADPASEPKPFSKKVKENAQYIWTKIRAGAISCYEKIKRKELMKTLKVVGLSVIMVAALGIGCWGIIREWQRSKDGRLDDATWVEPASPPVIESESSDVVLLPDPLFPQAVIEPPTPSPSLVTTGFVTGTEMTAVLSNSFHGLAQQMSRTLQANAAVLTRQVSEQNQILFTNLSKFTADSIARETSNRVAASVALEAKFDGRLATVASTVDSLRSEIGRLRNSINDSTRQSAVIDPSSSDRPPRIPLQASSSFLPSASDVPSGTVFQEIRQSGGLIHVTTVGDSNVVLQQRISVNGQVVSGQDGTPGIEFQRIIPEIPPATAPTPAAPPATNSTQQSRAQRDIHDWPTTTEESVANAGRGRSSMAWSDPQIARLPHISQIAQPTSAVVSNGYLWVDDIGYKLKHIGTSPWDYRDYESAKVYREDVIQHHEPVYFGGGSSGGTISAGGTITSGGTISAGGTIGN